MPLDRSSKGRFFGVGFWNLPCCWHRACLFCLFGKGQRSNKALHRTHTERALLGMAFAGAPVSAAVILLAALVGSLAWALVQAVLTRVACLFCLLCEGQRSNKALHRTHTEPLSLGKPLWGAPVSAAVILLDEHTSRL